MARMRAIFHRCIQDAQEYGSDDEYMVSRVFLSIEAEGRRFDNLYADLKQVIGGSFESDPIEVSPPRGYSGPVNYEAFRAAAEHYFRQLVGSRGSGIRTQGALKLRMRNNCFFREHSVEFEARDSHAPW